ncbi:MAG: HAMP domain-containing protein [Nitrospiraceae bacterium]|nr:MAG: HAMP domain-containing protein [Nitrospiraceae bacterium]
MDLKNISLRWKIAAPVIAAIIVGTVIVIAVTTARTRQIVIDEAKTTALNGYRDTVLNALTTMMIMGKFREAEKPFYEQMKHIADIRLIRSEALDKEFGNGLPDEYPRDETEKDVLEKGIEQIVIEGDYVRGVYPYIGKSDFMGKNCLSCHNVKEGTVLGAVSIRVSLTESFDKIRASRNLYLVIGLSGVLAVGSLVVLIAHIVLRPLSHLTEKVGRLSAGDLRVTIDSSGRDEIGVLALGLDKMVQSFSGIINNMFTSANNLADKVDILRGKADIASDGSKEQSAQSAQIATAAEEMSQTISAIAKNISTATEMSVEAMDLAEGGRQITDTSVETINEVDTSTKALAAMIDSLNGRVAEIGGIVTVITDIADQTNLLALNAAIESARAGEQGRGFAVVADEVRKLAERTIKATTEISEKIGAVGAETERTTRSMADSSKGITKAVGHIQNLNNVLQTIVESVRKVNGEIMQIAAAVEEQSSAAEDVARNVEKTSAIAKEMDKMAYDLMSEVGSMMQMTEELRDTETGFKTKGSELMMLDVAKTAHRLFVSRVGECLKGNMTLDTSHLPDHSNCRFGKWYSGEGMKMCGSLPSFKAIDGPHWKIHALAKEAVSAYNSGDRNGAKNIYEDMKAVSSRIGSLLDEIKREAGQD